MGSLHFVLQLLENIPRMRVANEVFVIVHPKMMCFLSIFVHGHSAVGEFAAAIDVLFHIQMRCAHIIELNTIPMLIIITSCSVCVEH